MIAAGAILLGVGLSPHGYANESHGILSVAMGRTILIIRSGLAITAELLVLPKLLSGR